MRIAVGSDHAGFELKQCVIPFLHLLGHEVLDLGTHNTDSVDYPDYAEKVGTTVRDAKADRGIIICGSGVGASVAANKIHGVRAGLCHDTYSAHQGVEHDDMNVLVLGGRVIGLEMAKELVRAFVSANFTAEERHVRRLKKVQRLEGKRAGEDRPTIPLQTNKNQS
ncbi:MAG TPA: ribose 5-phosphate isomerase B [Acidobacteriota bacterium]|nr:ribose 5-phosphate isomerase B [Acidobacteriota bacterium]